MELDKKQKRIIKMNLTGIEGLWNSLFAGAIMLISCGIVLVIVTVFYLINGDSGALSDLLFLSDIASFAGIFTLIIWGILAFTFLAMWCTSIVLMANHKDAKKAVKIPNVAPGTSEAASLSMAAKGTVIGTAASVKAMNQGINFFSNLKGSADKTKQKTGIKTNWFVVNLTKIIVIIGATIVIGVLIILGVADTMGVNDSYSAIVEMDRNCEVTKKCEIKERVKTEDGGYDVKYEYDDIETLFYINRGGYITKVIFKQDIENTDIDSAEIKALFIDNIEEFMKRMATLSNDRVKNHDKLREFVVDSTKVEEKEEDGKIKLTYSKDHLDW